ncbi:amidohydrolase [Actibacterium sp. MT2.3-13A]|uniref:amidohydrolase n=1 Tax=Actibacterium sp. MT2.3-13A TaxID=2828332 RepID=UPI001BA6AB02|nr:amidohydrolase [Actibacterium sp. MT2.3-13A]
MTPERRARLAALRHELHRCPELSGEEAATAARIAEFLAQHHPDALLTGLGGHGVAAVFAGAAAGPTVLIRAELDALPIEEISDADHRSAVPGRGHLCGHDGHMAMVAALAEDLRERPACGRVVLLFQPAEETGKGARAVLGDPRFAVLAPDYAFALHNTPGLPLGEVRLCRGAANCASRGMRVRLAGRTSHAAAPQDGISPMQVMARLMPGLVALGPGGTLDEGFAQVTLTHARLGEATFGVAPGAGEIWATLRTVTDARMQALCAAAEALVRREAGVEGLKVEIGYDDIFDASTNHPEAVAALERALIAEQTPWQPADGPQRWSEDFGRFGMGAKAAMFWLGAGEGQPQLHNPDYDFPDALIPIGAGIFRRAIRQLLG